MTNKTLIPVAIVIAAVIIGGAVLLTNRGGVSINDTETGNNRSSDVEFPEITSKDHILGNPNAKIAIVEYSDFECPFCQRFHPEMHQVIDEYGIDGEVSWVYRHFPIPQLHPKNAQRASIASECVASLGGEDAFWEFTDTYYERTPSNDRTDFDSLVGEIISELGIDVEEFQGCMNDGDNISRVKNDFDGAVAIGVRATPTSAFVFEKSLSPEGISVMDAIDAKYANQSNPNPVRRLNGNTIVLMSGAFPIEDIRVMIDTILFDQG